VRFERVLLRAPASRLPELATFYGDRLGVELESRAAGSLRLKLGETTLDLVPAQGEPFYHFALLVPGDRFDTALGWVAERVDLLGGVFDFDFWDAQACYFHDPAGNIVELIAHRSIGDCGTTGDFHARELLGLSELGLVGEQATMALELRSLGLELWDGTVDEPKQLAFLGEQARTLILAPPGRGWLPTGRPSEPHGLQVDLAGVEAGAVSLEGGRYLIRRRPQSPAARAAESLR
jgi:catechol 2,3-dioxygenase-like lactoylglutathione lyase family enzyme